MNENLKKQLGNLTEGAMTIPNLLSVIRIILIPVFLVLFLKGSYLAAVIVLRHPGLTDRLTETLAFNQVPTSANCSTHCGQAHAYHPGHRLLFYFMPLTTLCCAMAAGSSIFVPKEVLC